MKTDVMIRDNYALVFTPDRNHRDKDYTGAFQPEAENFVEMWSHLGGRSRIVKIDISKTPKEQEKAVLKELNRHNPDGDLPLLTAVVFFCHGFKHRIQFGFEKPAPLIRAIACASWDEVRVLFYSCSVSNTRVKMSEGETYAGGDGGFADLIRDGLCAEGDDQCLVIGHTTAGHTTHNPFVRIFPGMGAPKGGVGGVWVVDPTNKAMFRKWAAWLKKGNNRFIFPFLDFYNLHTSVHGEL